MGLGVWGLGCIEIVKGLGANNVLGETFWAKVLGETFWAKVFCLEPHFESGAGCWAGLGLGAGAGHGAESLGLGWRAWAGLWAGLGGWPGGWAWATLKRKLVCLKRKRKLVYSKMERCVSPEEMSFRMANSNKQFLFISFLRV